MFASAYQNTFAVLRQEAQMSQKEAAARAGVSLKTIYRWENGENKPPKPVIDMLRHAAGRTQTANQKKADFTFIDLFAGIGGFRMAFDSVGGACVYTSEWNKYSRETYAANFSCQHDVAGDITKVEADEIPGHDVLLAGFPCQPFSIAGVSKKKSLGREHGFLDKTQGTLFFDVARILEHHRPSAFLLENVKNLVGHDKGRTFKVIAETLDDLGYSWDFRVIDAKGFVPQHRERVFIAGFHEDTGFDFKQLAVPAPDEGPRLGTILHGMMEGEEPEYPYTPPDVTKPNDKYTLSDKLWTYLQDYAAKHKARGNGFGFGLNGPDDVARTLSARYYKDGSEILIRQKGKRPRRLTPRECARLMGFDAPRQPLFEIPVSDTQAYRQFGNAVVVPVVKAVASYMKPHILEVKQIRDSRQLTIDFRETAEAAHEAA